MDLIQKKLYVATCTCVANWDGIILGNIMELISPPQIHFRRIPVLPVALAFSSECSGWGLAGRGKPHEVMGPRGGTWGTERQRGGGTIGI